VSDLRRQLCGFLIHEETPVDSIIADHGLDVVLQEIESLLGTKDSEAIVHVLGFVRDAGLFNHPFHGEFRARLNSSSIWSTFRSLLLSPDFSVRRNVIYTIGKLTYRERSALLAEAFPFYLEKDPINLPGLLFELVWLTNEWNWRFLEQVASAEHYLQRWSLCQILDDNGSPTETLNDFASILNRLKSDPNNHVAAEAALRFERITIKLGPKLPKAEWRKEVKRISNLEPKVTFERAAMQFMRDREDYTLAEFDQFIGKLQ
jgi:hypothetical protein